jgi:Cu2+-exporting ATPase
MTMQTVSSFPAFDASACEPTASDGLCLHCRSALPSVRADGFCCSGCRHVYALLQTSGLGRYYALRGAQALAPVPQQQRRPEHAWIDALAADAGASATRRLLLDVQGIQCGACVWLIQSLFKRQPDALDMQLNPALGRLSCVVGPTFPLAAFVRGVEEFGYRLGPAAKAEPRERDTLLLRTGVCAALAGNTMFLGAATYLGLDSGPLNALFQNMSLAAATLSAFIGGSYFVERAVTGVKRGVLHLDLPIAVGMGLAYLGSVWSHLFAGGSASYFDTVSVFIALMLIGRLLQERLIEKNRRQLLESEGASSLLARRVREGRAEFVPCAALAAGDRLLVCPGEIVAVRARLQDESGSFGFDWINGESEPKQLRGGDEVVAGAINLGSSPVQAVALTGFESSELDLLLRDDNSAKQRLSGDFWDRTARFYVAAVLLATALGMLIGWLRGASLIMVLDVATAVLVVTCPCAFGIAVPLAYELGVAGLRRRGLFVRDAGFFDRAALVRRIVFDKTGTLTSGVPELKAPAVLERLTAPHRSVLYSMVAQSNHPKSTAVARALLDAFPALRVAELKPQELPGKGLECSADGVRYRFGEGSWALSDAAAPAGPVFSADGAQLAVLELVEVARPLAREELAQLEREGYELWIASGDADAKVKQLAASLSVPAERALGDLSPEDKRRLIERIDRRDTLMLGDGINDGPALSRALCSGTPAIDRPFVPARTDFYFLTEGLTPVRQALHVAAGVRRVVRKALWFAGLYNVLAVALAYAGVMRPWLAAVLMPASSIAVLAFTALALSARRYVWRS